MITNDMRKLKLPGIVSVEIALQIRVFTIIATLVRLFPFEIFLYRSPYEDLTDYSIVMANQM